MGHVNMDKRLRTHIGEIYGFESWEVLTAILWQNGKRWQLEKFDRDVRFEGQWWRCVIIEKVILDDDDITAVWDAEDVFSEAWVLPE